MVTDRLKAIMLEIEKAKEHKTREDYVLRMSNIEAIVTELWTHYSDSLLEFYNKKEKRNAKNKNN